MRKNALERVLKRRLGMGGTAENISLSLIKELIRAGYIENNTVPEIKSAKLGRLLTNMSDWPIWFIKRIKASAKRNFQWFLEWRP